MAKQDISEARLGRESSHSLRDGHSGTAIALLTLGSILAVAYPNPMMLPLVSGVLVASGMSLALVAIIQHGVGVWHTDRLIVPALLAFLGFAASIMSDPDRVVQSLRLISG